MKQEKMFMKPKRTPETFSRTVILSEARELITDQQTHENHAAMWISSDFAFHSTVYNFPNSASIVEKRSDKIWMGASISVCLLAVISLPGRDFIFGWPRMTRLYDNSTVIQRPWVLCDSPSTSGLTTWICQRDCISLVGTIGWEVENPGEFPVIQHGATWSRKPFTKTKKLCGRNR